MSAAVMLFARDAELLLFIEVEGDTVKETLLNPSNPLEIGKAVLARLDATKPKKTTKGGE